MTEPDTIKRLKSLRYGESFVYYKGNFANDIARCKPISAADPGAELYAKLLSDIQAAAINLERQGRVKLSQKIIELPPLPPLRTIKGASEQYHFEFIAEGI